jgi:hypothetical protein
LRVSLVVDGLRLFLHSYRAFIQGVCSSQCDCTTSIKDECLQRAMALRSHSYKSTMRFSTLALLIVLPATAYAAVCPQQHSVGNTYDYCVPEGEYCTDSDQCCWNMTCFWNGRSGVSYIPAHPSLLCLSLTGITLVMRRLWLRALHCRFWSGREVMGDGGRDSETFMFVMMP